MNAAILHDTTFPHGSPDGFTAGCHGAHCPAPVACRDVYRRYNGDWSFRKKIDAGATPVDIVAEEAERERVAAEEERAARRKAKARQRPKSQPKPKRSTYPRRQITGPTTHLQVAVTEMHAQGLTDSEIGEKLGKNREQIRSTRRHLELPLNPAKRTIDDVRELHAQGHDDVEIGRRLKKEVGYIAMLRRKANLPIIPHPRTKLDRDEMRRLHAAGYTDNQLAEHFGVPRHVAQKRRAYLHLTPNKPPATPGVSHSKETP